MMKIKFWIISIILIFACIMFFNLEVQTRKGIDYKWQVIKIPLGLKILDFYDRHFNYKFLVKNITKGVKGDQQRVMQVFKWTHLNIKKETPSLPIVDDHVWHTIIRGYGASDQSSDVFVTLCNYAGLKAFYGIVYSKNKDSNIVLSFVELNKKWFVFDPYSGVYFKNREGNLASVSDIINHDYTAIDFFGDRINIDYPKYLQNLSDIGDIGFNRANIQSPMRRIIYEVKKWLKLN